MYDPAELHLGDSALVVDRAAHQIFQANLLAHPGTAKLDIVSTIVGEEHPSLLIVGPSRVRDRRRLRGVVRQACALSCLVWIADGLPHDKLRVESYVNQKPAQLGHTSQMLFSVPRLIAFVSSVMTLFPGDIISTGAPAGVA